MVFPGQHLEFHHPLLLLLHDDGDVDGLLDGVSPAGRYGDGFRLGLVVGVVIPARHGVGAGLDDSIVSPLGVGVHARVRHRYLHDVRGVVVMVRVGVMLLWLL